jgi:hypothetical protein
MISNTATNSIEKKQRTMAMLGKILDKMGDTRYDVETEKSETEDAC